MVVPWPVSAFFARHGHPAPHSFEASQRVASIRSRQSHIALRGYETTFNFGAAGPTYYSYGGALPLLIQSGSGSQAASAMRLHAANWRFSFVYEVPGALPRPRFFSSTTS